MQRDLVVDLTSIIDISKGTVLGLEWYWLLILIGASAAILYFLNWYNTTEQPIFSSNFGYLSYAAIVIIGMFIFISVMKNTFIK